MEAMDLLTRFMYHAPKGDQSALYEKVRGDAHQLAVDLNSLCPDSRELSLAITKLEEVVFWANAAIARYLE